MLKYIRSIDNNVLDIPELKQLRHDHGELTKDKSNKDLKNECYKSSVIFFNWYIKYCSSIIGEKIYTNKLISECIFRPNIKSEKQHKEFILKSIYISKTYVEYLKEKISETNIHKYDETISNLTIDLEWLIADAEIYYKKSVDRIYYGSWRRKKLSPTDIYYAAKSMFYIEEVERLEDLYLRDLKPVVMFQIRQMLEVFGKNIIGYNSISNKDGGAVKKFTQIAWDFIKDEIKKPVPKIVFPFDIHMILAINNWSNGFVHTTFLHSNYIQHFALETLKVLFIPTSTAIKIYTGKSEIKFNHSAIRITNYNLFKTEFETFLKSRMSEIVIEWKETKDVGAYIISE